MLRLRQRERQAVRARSHRGRNRLPEKRSRDGSYFIFSSFSWHDLGSGWAMCGVETLDGNLRSQARLRFSERRAELESKLGKVTLPQKEKKKKGVYLKRQGEVMWYTAAQRIESGPDVFTTKGN